MRVLVLPNCSKDVLNDSHWYLLMQIINGSADLPMWFTVLTPATGLAGGANYDLVPFPLGVSRMSDEVAPTVDLYRLLNIRSSPLDFDCVLNQRTIFAPSLRRLVKAKTQRFNVDVPIFNLYPQVKKPDACKSGALTFYGDDELVLEACSAFMDYAITLNDYEKSNLFETVRAVMKPSMLKDFDDRVFPLFLVGIDFDEMQRVRGRRVPQDVPVVFYGGRLNRGQKRIEMVLDTMSEIHKVRPHYRFAVCTFETENKLFVEKYPFVEWHFEAPRSLYLDLVSQATVGIYCAVEEGVGTCNFEWLLGGAVSVIRDAPWVQGDLPGYPFVVGNALDHVAVAIWVCEHQERANEMAEPIRAYLRREYNQPWRFRQMYEFMKARESNPGPVGSLAELVKAALDGLGGEVSQSALFQKMTELSEKHRAFGGPDLLNRFYLRRIVSACGWIDKCDGPEPLYVKGGD